MFTVKVKFPESNGEYSYGSFDNTIRVGDKVVVDTPVGGLKLVRVVAVTPGFKNEVTKLIVGTIDLRKAEDDQKKLVAYQDLKRKLDARVAKFRQEQEMKMIAEMDSEVRSILNQMENI